MISRGVALTISSLSAYGDLIGSQKKTCRPLTGSLPSAMNSPTPITTVISSARTGDA